MDLKSKFTKATVDRLNDRKAVIPQSRFRKTDLYLSLMNYRSGLTIFPGWLTGVFAYYIMQNMLPESYRIQISNFYSKILMTQKISAGSGTYYGSQFDKVLKKVSEGLKESDVIKDQGSEILAFQRYLPHETTYMEKYSCTGQKDYSNVYCKDAVLAMEGWKDTIERIGYLAGNSHYLEVCMNAVQESPQLWRETSLPLLFKAMTNTIPLPGGHEDKAGGYNITSQYADITLLYRLQITADSAKDQASADIYKSLTLPYDYFKFKDDDLRGVDLEGVDFKSAVASKVKLFTSWLPRFLAMNWNEFAKSIPSISGSAKDDPIAREIMYATMSRALYSIVIAPYISEMMIRFQELSHPWLLDIYKQSDVLMRKYEELKKAVAPYEGLSMANWSYLYSKLNSVEKCPVKGTTLSVTDLPRWIINLLTGSDLLTIVNKSIKKFSSGTTVTLKEGLWLHNQLQYDSELNDPTNILMRDNEHVSEWDNVLSTLQTHMESTKNFIVSFTKSQEMIWYMKPQWAVSMDNAKKYIKSFETRYKQIFDITTTSSVMGVSKYSAEYADQSAVEHSCQIFEKFGVNLIMEKGRKVNSTLHESFNMRKRFALSNISIRNLPFMDTYKRIVDGCHVAFNYFKCYRSPHFGIDRLFPWGNVMSKLHPALSVKAGTKLYAYERLDLISALNYNNLDTYESEMESYFPQPSNYSKIADTDPCNPSLEHILELAAGLSNIGVVVVLKGQNGLWTDDELKEEKSFSSVINFKINVHEYKSKKDELNQLSLVLRDFENEQKKGNLNPEQLSAKAETEKKLKIISDEIKAIENQFAWLSNPVHNEGAFEKMLQKWWIPGYTTTAVKINTVEHSAKSFAHRPMGLNLSKPENMCRALYNTTPIKIIKGIWLLPYTSLQLPPSINESRSSDNTPIKLVRRMTWGFEANLISPSDAHYYRDLRTTSIIGNDFIYEPKDNAWMPVNQFYVTSSHYEMRYVGIETTKNEFPPVILFFKEGQVKGGFTLNTLYQSIVDDGIIFEPDLNESAKTELTIPSSIIPTTSSKGYESIVPSELEDGGVL
jgi:hypothetical protein